MKRVGILGFQGAIVEHEQHLRRVGCEPVVVRYVEQLDAIDAMILPGGESTTMGNLMQRTGLMEPLREKIVAGMPVWGTCAGMILLAKKLVNDSTTHLATMDIAVRRNAYGSQIDSFSAEAVIPAVGEAPIPLVFIRAPYITEVETGVQVLCRLDGNIVAAREGNMLGTSFHPELTDCSDFHRYFTAMIE